MDKSKQDVIIFIVIIIFTTGGWKYQLRGPTNTDTLWTTPRDSTTKELSLMKDTLQNNLDKFYPFPNFHILF